MLKGSLDEPIVDHSASISRRSEEQVANAHAYRFIHDHQSRFENDIHTEVEKCTRIEYRPRSSEALVNCEHVAELLCDEVPSAAHKPAGGPSLAGSLFESALLSPRCRLYENEVVSAFRTNYLLPAPMLHTSKFLYLS
jgi:hypothetical protein